MDKKIISVRDNVEILSRINHYLALYQQTTDDFIEKFMALDISDNDIAVIEYVNEQLKTVSTWNESQVEALINNAMADLSLGKGKVMKPIRKSMTGDESGPNLVCCLALFSFDEIKKRLGVVLKHVNSTASN